MELKWLEDFVCLANIGSFWKASQERHVSQPAFSRRIRALEDWLGVELVDRSSYPITLTPYGRQFLPYAQEMLKTSKGIREEFRVLAGARANEIRIATLHTLSIHFLPPIIDRFVVEHPQAKPIIISSMQGVDHHFDALANGIIHLLVTFGDEAIVANIAHLDALEEHTLGIDELVPVASAGLAQRLRLRNLETAKGPVPFLAYSSFSFSERLVAPVVSALGSKLRIVCESGLSEGLAALARRDLGIAWLPASTIAADLASGTLVVLGGSEVRVPLTIKAYRSKALRSPMVDAMWLLIGSRRSRAAAQGDLKNGRALT
jgi:LysR family transcriptional regulator, hypochlorite-specific transcription factor HypT